MNWSELLNTTQINNIEVTIINPVRKSVNGEYEKGDFGGFKSGVIGGGHSNWKNGESRSYDSTKRHWIKKPKVLVVYNCFTYGKSQHSDWIDVENCTFEIKEKDNG